MQLWEGLISNYIEWQNSKGLNTYVCTQFSPIVWHEQMFLMWQAHNLLLMSRLHHNEPMSFHHLQQMQDVL
jgi:hypothetical protein